VNTQIPGIAIATISLCISAATLWLTYLRRGRLRMTTPSVVFFGYDRVPKVTPKVFLRTLLYSTANQGQVIEWMYARLTHGTVQQAFSFWGYGETEKLSPGSGLFASRTGFAANHHFVLSVHEEGYEFTEGTHEVEVFARVVGRKPARLFSLFIDVTPEQAAALRRHEGILYERRPDGSFEGHARGL